MRLPRKGILIRIVIYGSLLGYFGWQALQRYQLEQEQLEREQDQSQRAKQLEQLGGIPTFEITPEQARELYGIEVDENGHIIDPGAKPSPGPATNNAPETAKPPTGAPPHGALTETPNAAPAAPTGPDATNPTP